MTLELNKSINPPETTVKFGCKYANKQCDLDFDCRSCPIYFNEMDNREASWREHGN